MLREAKIHRIERKRGPLDVRGRTLIIIRNCDDVDYTARQKIT